MSRTNSSLPRAAVSQGPPGLVEPPNTAAFLRHLRTPSSVSDMDHQMADLEHLMKILHTGQSDEVSFPGASHTHRIYSQDDLPTTVARTLNQGSHVMSLDFHPQKRTILLVGTNVGDIGIWEVGSRIRIAHKTFKVWDIPARSMPSQVRDATVSVNRCLWSPDGTILGVAFSMHIVQTYVFYPNGELKPHLELGAHIGGVNDIAFCHPSKSLSVITCGDDMTIKVWDATSGQRLYIFEGHAAPVYSVCPHYYENIQFIFSTSVDGKIKAWLYDCLGSNVVYDAPGHCCTTMKYSADGTRLFSCGTGTGGDSHLVEWNETEGAIMRTYTGFRKHSLGVVQFDTIRNRFLAAGDEFMIKFWDMDKDSILKTVDADGGLPASPRLRFNKEGSLLAIATNDNGIKILANNDGHRLLRMLENGAYEGSHGPQQINTERQIVNALGAVSNVSVPSAPTMERTEAVDTSVPMSSLTTMDNNRMVDVKPRIPNDADKTKSWKLADIVDNAQLNSLHLPDAMTTASKVVRLLYTHSGDSVLALSSDAVHNLWRWARTERNPSGRSTPSFAPLLWQPESGIMMTNEANDGISAEESTVCMALSKTDSYLMSASGGKVSLFNMMTFKVMTTFMSPPPAVTSVEFYPQDNNIAAIGMEDSTIRIYNVQIDQVKTSLKGHQKKITGLAFSKLLNVLVSAGADAQLCVWSTDGWEKKKSRLIQAPAGHAAPLSGETRVQFHNDQSHLLVVHESQLSIYDGELECIRMWSPRDSLPAPISCAAYSCDGLSVYTGFTDGAVGIFDSKGLRLRCRIAPSAYMSPTVPSGQVCPLAIAAHPSKANQIALGMSDGAVYVMKPSKPKCGASPPEENGSLPSSPSIPIQRPLPGNGNAYLSAFRKFDRRSSPSIPIQRPLPGNGNAYLSAFQKFDRR